MLDYKYDLRVEQPSDNETQLHLESLMITTQTSTSSFSLEGVNVSELQWNVMVSDLR